MHLTYATTAGDTASAPTTITMLGVSILLVDLSSLHPCLIAVREDEMMTPAACSSHGLKQASYRCVTLRSRFRMSRMGMAVILFPRQINVIG